MIHRVTKATARTDYTVEVVFETGDRAMIDFSAFVADGEVTEPLRADPTYFASTLRILPRGDGIGWPGDVDIDADALWYKAHPEDWERDYGEAGRAASA
jgi:uncharacterized protein DUF2442